MLAPHAHADLLRLETSAALGTPGVVTVLTGADVPGEGDSGPVRHDEPIFPSEVMFHNQPVAWVLGETPEAARLGALAVGAEYRPLTPILSVEDAIAAKSFHSGPLTIRRGDLAAELARSEHRIEGELHIGGQEHFYLETQATLAWLDESGGVSLHSSTQHPSETQEIVARVLGVPRHMVTVECLRMGGAFGGKETQANCFAAVAALGARKTGRPVRIRFSRRLDMTITGKRHPFLARFVAGFASDGRLQAARIQLYADGGWSLDLSEAILGRAMFHVDNTYYLPALEVTGWVAKTHKTSQTAFRGFGGPQGMLVIEDILDRVARTLGLPPDVVRERNFYREGQSTHYGQPVKDAERIARIWEQVKESSNYEARREEIAAFNAAHPHCRRGIAITPVKFGISFTATHYNQAGALVLVYRDGSVQVNHGGTEMGQGLYTKIGQIAVRCPGREAGGDSPDAHAHGQNSQYVGDRCIVRRRSKRRGRARRLPHHPRHVGCGGGHSAGVPRFGSALRKWTCGCRGTSGPCRQLCRCCRGGVSTATAAVRIGVLFYAGNSLRPEDLPGASVLLFCVRRRGLGSGT